LTFILSSEDIWILAVHKLLTAKMNIDAGLRNLQPHYLFNYLTNKRILKPTRQVWFFARTSKYMT